MSMDQERLQPGTVIAHRYTVERCIGAGGMGAVYLASDAYLDGDKIAMKVLHPDLVADEKQSQRFMREIQLMRRVDDANVVKTYDVGSQDDIVFFTMEYVPGKPLESFIEGQSFPKGKISQLITQVSTGLHAIHRANIIHRDLKPANILVLDNFQTKITDFGVARPEFSELTAHNEIIGSALYIAPEVWLGIKLTSSVDLYSFGVVLYELTTGVLPFDGDSPASLMRMHLEFKPIPPKELNPEIAPWLNKLILNLLAKTPEERPRDARELIDYIEMQTGSGREKIVTHDNFMKSLELDASKVDKAKETKSLIKTKAQTLILADDPAAKQRTVRQEFLASTICGIIGVLTSLGLIGGVYFLRIMFFPDLESIIFDLSRMNMETLSGLVLSPLFLVLLVLRSSFIGGAIFSFLGAATGSLKTTLKMILFGVVWSFFVFFLCSVVTLLQKEQGSLLITEPGGFSFMISLVKCALATTIMDSKIWTIREVIFDPGIMFYPEAVGIFAQRSLAALQFLSVIVFFSSAAYLAGIKRCFVSGIVVGMIVFFIAQEIGGVDSTTLVAHSNPGVLLSMIGGSALFIFWYRIKRQKQKNVP